MAQITHLLHALHNNPSIKRLAVNPLMLTILAIIQKEGQTLPQRRIDLYEVVTRALLDIWNQESGRRVLPAGEIQLADRLLAALAYHMHSRDPLMTEGEVRQVASQVMRDFSNHPYSDEEADQFIDVLRSSSGLFVESGQGWFSFMHRTFQEYYVALYLLDKHNYPADKLKDFICAHYTLPVWREPLLLAIAYESGQHDRDEQQASTLIQAIMGKQDRYDRVLQRGLLFAANSIVDCYPWSILTDLQCSVAYALFALYGDYYDTGRYTALQQDIEQVVLLWLRGQPQESSKHGTWTPLLQSWRSALCDSVHPLRQEGAAHLLVVLAPDLGSYLGSVLTALLPPLLQLADVLDMPYPPALGENLPQPVAQPATQKSIEYAVIALRLLDKDGPAGWLHKVWQTWNAEQPAILERLTQHALAIDYLLTPAAFPTKRNDPNRSIQSKIYNDWQKRARRNPRDLQAQLLQASHTARYPNAFLFQQMLMREVQAPNTQHPWQELWNNWLKAEMARGRDVTYQASLYLRLLLTKGNAVLRGEIANELIVALSSQSSMRTQALITITNLCLQDLEGLRDVFMVLENSYREYITDRQYMLDIRNRYNRWDMLYIRYMSLMLNMRDLLYTVDWPPARFIDDERSGGSTRLKQYMLEVRDALDMRDVLSREQIVEMLCNILMQRATGELSLTLFAVYSILTSYKDNRISQKTIKGIQNAINALKQPAQALTVEQHQLIAVIQRHLHSSASSNTHPQHGDPDVLAANLYPLRQQRQLTAEQVKALLSACVDTRTLQPKNAQIMAANVMGHSITVQMVAWGLLSQQFSLDEQAATAALHALDDDEAIVCAAAARLLQGCKTLSLLVKEEGAQKLLHLLADEILSRRPLDVPAFSLSHTGDSFWRQHDMVWQLDDVLFVTLRGLV